MAVVDWSKEKVLITGATGFLGTNLVKALIREKADLYAINIEDQKIEGVKTKQINLKDYDRLKEFVDEIKPTIVFHLGALVVLSRDFGIALECVDSNIKGTLNLLEAIKDLKLKRFLFLSTEEVYGDNPLPFSEDQLPKPPSPYAVSKVAGENFCSLYFRLYGVPATTFRINTIYGPNQPAGRFIPSLIIKALKNEPIDFNSGKNKRDYLFVDDLVQAILLTAEDNARISGEIINIGSGEPISGRELAETVLRISNSKSKINFNAFPDREGEAAEWRADNSKAKRLLSWQPATSLISGLSSTIKYYQGEINGGK